MCGGVWVHRALTPWLKEAMACQKPDLLRAWKELGNWEVQRHTELMGHSKGKVKCEAGVRLTRFLF